MIFRFLLLPHTPARPGVAAGHSAFFESVSPGIPIPFGLALAAAAVERVLGGIAELADWPDVNVRHAVKAARQALRISNDEAEQMEGALYGLGQLLGNPNPPVAAMKRFLARPTAPLSRALFAALPAGLAGHREAMERRLAELERTDYSPVPLISGDDLTAAGLAPGPLFKRVLDEVYDAQLEDRVTTRDQAMHMALAIAATRPAT